MAERSAPLGGSSAEPLPTSTWTVRRERPREAVRARAGSIGEQLRQAGESLLLEQKQRAADAVHAFAEAFRHAAQALHHQQKPLAARYAEQVAERVDGFSRGVRDRDWREAVATAENYARRQPALFLAGAMTLGFLAARLLAPPNGAPAAQGFATTGDEAAIHPADVEIEAGYVTGSAPGAGIDGAGLGAGIR